MFVAVMGCAFPQILLLLLFVIAAPGARAGDHCAAATKRIFNSTKTISNSLFTGVWSIDWESEIELRKRWQFQKWWTFQNGELGLSILEIIISWKIKIVFHNVNKSNTRLLLNLFSLKNILTTRFHKESKRSRDSHCFPFRILRVIIH